MKDEVILEQYNGEENIDYKGFFLQPGFWFGTANIDGKTYDVASSGWMSDRTLGLYFKKDDNWELGWIETNMIKTKDNIEWDELYPDNEYDDKNYFEGKTIEELVDYIPEESINFLKDNVYAYIYKETIEKILDDIGYDGKIEEGKEAEEIKEVLRANTPEIQLNIIDTIYSNIDDAMYHNFRYFIDNVVEGEVTQYGFDAFKEDKYYKPMNNLYETVGIYIENIKEKVITSEARKLLKKALSH